MFFGMKSLKQYNNDVQKYINEYLMTLSIEKQFNVLELYYDELNIDGEIDKYIKENKELYDFMFRYFIERPFVKISESLQTKLITENLDKIKNLGDDTQLNIWMETINISLQNYLFEYLNITKKLALKTSNNIIYCTSKVKDINVFKKIFYNVDIFERIMSKSKPYEHLGILTEDYYYSHFDSCTEEIQNFILGELFNKDEYKEQYLEFLKNASDNVKLKYIDKIPEKGSELVAYLKSTKSKEAKEKLIESIANKDYYSFQEIPQILDFYPEIIDETDMEIVLNNLDMWYILMYYNLHENPLTENIKKIIENRFINSKLSIYGAKYDFLKNNIFSNKDNLIKVLNNSKAYQLLNCLEYCKDDLVYNIIKEKLELNPDFLREINSTSSFIPSKYIKELFDYLDPTFAISLINRDEICFLIKKLKERPELAQYISDNILAATIIDELDASSNLLNYFSSESFIEAKTIDNHFDKFILSINENRVKNYHLNGIYKKLTKEQKLRLLNNLNNYEILPELCCSETEFEIKNIIYNLIILNQEKIFTYNIEKSLLYEFNDLPISEYELIIAKLNDNSIINLFSKVKNQRLEETLFSRFNSNNNIFNNCVTAEEAFSFLSKDNKNFIYKKMESRLQQILGSNIELYNKIILNNSILNFKFIEACEKGIFSNQESFIMFVKLIEKNQHIISTLNFEMLSNDFIYINGHFIEKVSKYPEVQERILNIKRKSKSFENFKQILSVISRDENKIFDRKLMKILSSFENNEFNFTKQLSEKEINNLIRYILISSETFQFSKNHLDVSDINPLDFDNGILSKCDKLLNEAKSIEDYKNVFFIKYFDMTYSDAKEFVRMYDNNMSGVSIDNSALDFMQNIKDIIEIDNINMLYELYYSYNPRYTINDVFEIENCFQKAYTRELQQSLFDGKGIEKQITIDGENIMVLEPLQSFKILTHSTNAYSNMPLINNNYYQSWNLSKKTNNHGICTALVSDKCLGLPPLGKEGYGCIFGFTEFSEDSVTNIAPYDLCSTNGEYELKTERPLIYTSSNNMIDMTRHSHNECVIERTNLLNDNSVNIQPQYVIITSEMNELQMKNSLKASKEMNPPNGLPIVYLDIEKIVKNNKININKKIQEFITTKDINCFKELLSDYETVKCTLKTIKNYDFIDVKEIDRLIEIYIDFCISLNESEKTQRLKELESALNEEKRKFDLVADSGNRIKVFDIKYDEHIQKINIGLKPNENMYEISSAKKM